MNPIAQSIEDLVIATARQAVRENNEMILAEIRDLIAEDPSQILSTAQMAEVCPAYSVGALGKLAQRGKRNGLIESGALTKKGGKWLWNKRRFFDWVNSKNDRPSSRRR